MVNQDMKQKIKVVNNKTTRALNTASGTAAHSATQPLFSDKNAATTNSNEHFQKFVQNADIQMNVKRKEPGSASGLVQVTGFEN